MERICSSKCEGGREVIRGRNDECIFFGVSGGRCGRCSK